MGRGPTIDIFALQHVEKLRQLVDARLTQPCTDICHSRVARTACSIFAPSSRAVMVRNLKILNFLLLNPFLVCMKSAGPGEVKFDRKGDD